MNTSHRLLIGTIVLADSPRRRGAERRLRLAAMARPRGDGTLTASPSPSLARCADAAMEDHRWRGLFHADSGRQPRLSVLAPGRNEVLRAIDADTGKSVWERPYAAVFQMNNSTSRHGPGPKSTRRSLAAGCSRWA
jgi:hypothetical protein